MAKKTDGKTTAQLVAEGKVPPHYAVPKSDGDAAVQAWIALLPDWQRDLARIVDGIATEQVAHLHKAIRWHGAWYGVKGGGWFMAVNSLKRTLKLTFFDGLSLSPLPPFAYKIEPNRGLDIHEGEPLDKDILTGWIAQASRLPGYGKA